MLIIIKVELDVANCYSEKDLKEDCTNQLEEAASFTYLKKR